MLHTKYISCGPYGFREEDFLSFSHYTCKPMGAIYRHGGHLDLQTVTIFKFKKFGPGVSEEKLFKGVNGQTDRRTGSDHNSSS